MAPAAQLKIAFVGSHGVGKTTLCYGLAARLKARDVSLEMVHEVARRCPLPINEATGVGSQSWILHTQIAEEIAASARSPVVICDRSVLDNYVYLLIAAGRQVHLEAAVADWLATYDLLVLVPVTSRPSPDGVRATDPAFQELVETRVRQELDRRGVEALTLDPSDRDAWLEQVESAAIVRLASPQLELL